MFSSIQESKHLFETYNIELIEELNEFLESSVLVITFIIFDKWGSEENVVGNNVDVLSGEGVVDSEDGVERVAYSPYWSLDECIVKC
jgi:hypothetical protein